jgi:uncharacterized protein (DUF697 family)
MAGWRDLGNIWTTFRQLDIRPIQEEAEQPVVLAIVGADGAGKSTLIAALRHDVRVPEKVITPTVEADLASAGQMGSADLIILVLDASRGDLTGEADAYREWTRAGHQVVVFYNKIDAVRQVGTLLQKSEPWTGARVAFGSALDPDSLATEFIPRVMDALPEQHLSLARHYPLFRFAVARELINDTSFANATYALGTGLAEVIPALDIPFNVADVVILTKNQALMVYKLGLALGLSPRWQDHVRQLGGVVGAGFVWRQVARQLVGLIPVWGIIPKVAVAYAGTYAVGQAVIYWYQTGHKITGSGMRQLYADALARGRQVAQSLLERTPRPSLPKVSMPALTRPRSKITCSNCGKENARDATYCAYCGRPLMSE